MSRTAKTSKSSLYWAICDPAQVEDRAVYVRQRIVEGTSQTLGKLIELDLDLDEAIRLQKSLVRCIEELSKPSNKGK
jgi:hypothetical protein